MSEPSLSKRKKGNVPIPVLGGTPNSHFFWAWDSCSLNVLIPEKSGKEWMAVPAGHHQSKRTSAMEHVGRCDVCGMDGYLNFECGSAIATYPEKRIEFENRVLPEIEKWYACERGYEVRFAGIVEVLHPSKRSKAASTGDRPDHSVRDLNSAEAEAERRSRSRSGPVRVTLSRKKGWRMPENTVKVDRTTEWGNPFAVGKPADKEALGYQTPKNLIGAVARDNAHAVELFRQWIKGPSDRALGLRIALTSLRGKNFACWCRAGSSCHADVLLEVANKHND